MDEKEPWSHGKALGIRSESGGGARIHRPAVPTREPMLHVVSEDVVHRVRDFTRALQGARVEAVGEDLAAKAMHAIEGTRHPHREALHPARQRDDVVGFYQEVQMVPLHGELDRSQPEALLALAQCPGDGSEAATSSQTRKTVAHPHR